MTADAQAWACVKDRKTGLLWEVKTDDGGLRDKDNRYTLFQPEARPPGKANGGRCSGGISCDTDGYLRALNRSRLCGVEHWRLPDKKEAATVVRAGNPRPWPALDPAFFPHAQGQRFWLGERDVQRFVNRNWVFDSDTGSMEDFYRDYGFAVRAVARPQ